MQLYVWVPGILGTALRQIEAPLAEIWPPGSTNAFQSRTFKQLTDTLAPTHIIQDVCTLAIYSTVTRLFQEAGIADVAPGDPTAGGLLQFPYDWRLGIEATADLLGARLDALTSNSDEIVILAHSMGGLVVRFLLEAEKYAGRPFRSRVQKFVAVNGVLLGAPVMLARAFGIEPTEFIQWAEQPRLLGTAPFSGSYSLLPAPSKGRLFNGDSPIDIYNPYYFQYFNFGAQNMGDAVSVWEQLQAGRRDPLIKYVLIASYLNDHTTIECVRYVGSAWTREYGPGDGTVPTWSSQGLPDAITPALLPGEHRGVLDTAGFRTLFSQYVATIPGASAPSDTLTLQPLKLHFPAGGIAEMAIVREGSAPVSQGTLTWTQVSDRGVKAGAPLRTETVAVPAQSASTIHSRVPDQAANYELAIDLDGNLASTRVSVRPISESAPATAPPAPSSSPTTV